MLSAGASNPAARHRWRPSSRRSTATGSRLASESRPCYCRDSELVLRSLWACLILGNHGVRGQFSRYGPGSPARGEDHHCRCPRLCRLRRRTSVEEVGCARPGSRIRPVCSTRFARSLSHVSMPGRRRPPGPRRTGPTDIPHSLRTRVGESKRIRSGVLPLTGAVDPQRGGVRLPRVMAQLSPLEAQRRRSISVIEQPCLTINFSLAMRFGAPHQLRAAPLRSGQRSDSATRQSAAAQYLPRTR